MVSKSKDIFTAKGTLKTFSETFLFTVLAMHAEKVVVLASQSSHRIQVTKVASLLFLSNPFHPRESQSPVLSFHFFVFHPKNPFNSPTRFLHCISSWEAWLKDIKAVIPTPGRTIHRRNFTCGTDSL